MVGLTSSGILVRQYQLSCSVSYADLDLATSAGADELKRRVTEAARSACKDLDKLYPETDPDRSCPNKAVDNSIKEVARHQFGADAGGIGTLIGLLAGRRVHIGRCGAPGSRRFT